PLAPRTARRCRTHARDGQCFNILALARSPGYGATRFPPSEPSRELFAKKFAKNAKKGASGVDDLSSPFVESLVYVAARSPLYGRTNDRGIRSLAVGPHPT